MIFLKCKILFIYVGFNCKRKKTILNFHFDNLTPSLITLITLIMLITSTLLFSNSQSHWSRRLRWSHAQFLSLDTWSNRFYQSHIDFFLSKVPITSITSITSITCAICKNVNNVYHTNHFNYIGLLTLTIFGITLITSIT